jgi:hypothetical protein
MADVNADSENHQHHQLAQRWLDGRVAKNYSQVPYRTWFIQASDGTQVARVPKEEDGNKASSLGVKFAYRDYFHGMGLDYSPQERINSRPLSEPHNSTVFRSTVDGDLAMVLSVPIRDSDENEPLGVLAMSVGLGHFADQMSLPEGQGVLLVEARRYYMLGDEQSPDGERGEGLVLHHQLLAQRMNQKPLPHLDDEFIYLMRAAKDRWTQDPSKEPDNLMPQHYKDPLSDDPNGSWLAAFAPVLVYSRPQQQQDTGWFAIVQQQRSDDLGIIGRRQIP